MKFISTPLEGLLIIEPRVFVDERGFFYESFNEQVMLEHGIKGPFIQDNQSVSHKGVLRGLHFQLPPYQQGKLIRVVNGGVLDIVVDIRKNSKTYLAANYILTHWMNGFFSRHMLKKHY